MAELSTSSGSAFHGDEYEHGVTELLVAEEHSRKRLKRSRSGVDLLSSDHFIDSKRKASQPRHVLHHQVYCDQRIAEGHNHEGHLRTATFLDVPRLFAHDNRAAQLRGREPVYDSNIYQHQHGDVCMIVYQRYSCHDYHEEMHDKFTKFPIPADVKSMGPHDIRPWFYVLLEDGPHASPVSEYIAVSSEDLRRAMKALTKVMPRTFNDWESQENLESPYSFFYHYVREIHKFAQELLPPDDRSLVTVLLEYVIESQREDFAAADRLFERGYISRSHFGKVFKVDDIVLQKTPAGVRGFQVESIGDDDDDELELACMTWDFDGRFYETRQTINVQRPNVDDEEYSIHELKVWPLRLDKPEVAEDLRRRGEMFWSLRSRRLVHYKAPASTTFEIRTSNPKYMIDMAAYKDLHHQNDRETDPDREYLGTLEMSKDEPPAGSFISMLPAEVIGFGFHDKKWRKLYVSNMKNVVWNKRAFQRLVLKLSKKELIEALVRVHLGTAAPSDVIEDKGAGLIMLLHGPPGTGKTLTAESVAELAEKPLYRITCGDMGTDPESVEKYLESALYIGTMWGCVVLLDEADVFLEERTQTDLVRNALVSVFLRVLEYYDGILILTSNRVGTFDEAFKSRMQLAVHYPTLTEYDRRSIWRAFFQSLYESKVILDKEDLDSQVERLAVHKFNGRQIRNIIKTARQLAAHRNRTGFHAKDLDDVIEVANDFDTYITNTRGHTDEQWASESRTRAKEGSNR